jgi:hypothetical protein
MHEHPRPKTAEALMRSRFAAVRDADAEWLLASWHPSTPARLARPDRQRYLARPPDHRHRRWRSRRRHQHRRVPATSCPAAGSGGPAGAIAVRPRGQPLILPRHGATRGLRTAAPIPQRSRSASGTPERERPDRCFYVLSRLLSWGFGGFNLTAAAGGGHDRDGPLLAEGTLLSGHDISAASGGSRGGRRIVRRPARLRQPNSGSGRPREIWR